MYIFIVSYCLYVVNCTLEWPTDSVSITIGETRIVHSLVYYDFQTCKVIYISDMEQMILLTYPA